MVHRTIYEELCLGEIEEASCQACLKIIEGLEEQGAEGIILGCTELPLLVHPDVIQVPVFDTTRLHAKAAVNWRFPSEKAQIVTRSP
ncbi:MAG: aspartate/glutamate racemase family protein [Deltaproteobacteria bacterium]|nr:aspartate/glutamate racemase family protein [Deltaproteobacteria bacterium]